MRISMRIGLAAACLAAVGIAGTGLLTIHRTIPAHAAAEKPEAVLTVEASPVSGDPLPRRVTVIASLRAVQEVTLSTEVDGRVTAIHFQGGGHIKAGTPLIDLFSDPQHAELARTKADEVLARLQVDRANELIQRAATAQAEVDKRKATLDQATAMREAAEAALAQRFVKAPFSGELGLRRTDLGHYLKAGDAIVTLTNLDALFVDFAIPQRHLGNLRIGQAVTVSSDAAGDRTFTARLETIEPQIDRQTRNIRLRARLDNREALLRPGASASATLEFAPEAGVATVPETAIMASAATDTAFVVRNIDREGRGRLDQVSLATGRREDGRVVVSDGLKAGEFVVTAGQVRLANGQAVRIDGYRPLATASAEPGIR